MADRKDILTPAARLVGGSLYEGEDTDADGNPLLVKNGANKGQPRKDFWFKVAIPKGAEQHWAQTDWGRDIYTVGSTAHPHAHQTPTFSWKVQDGDSQIPNAKGRRPCDNEGFPGHWVLSFSSGYMPKVVNKDGTQTLTEVGLVKSGYWVQVFGSIAPNEGQRPGVYLNHTFVAFLGYDKEIVVGPDPKSIGFGAVALPAGVSATPQAGAWNPAAAPGLPAPLVAPVAAAIPPLPAPVVPVAVAPNPAILAVPAAPVLPPPVPAAPAGPVMTPKANGATYQQYRDAGWSDEQMRQQGVML